MDPSSAQHHHQEMSSQTLESMLVCTKPQQEKKPRPAEQALKCPRCDSSNTKFCYYNNYSLSQPRYFCKSCRRYWTKGGTLRNVPVGGGCRKNKRSSSSSSSSKRNQDLPIAGNSTPFPSLTPLGYDSSDLGLAIARLQKQSVTGKLGFDEHDFSIFGAPNIPHSDILGSSGVNSPVSGFFGGFLDAPGGFHNLCYGNNNMGQFENSGLGINANGEEMAVPYGEDQMSGSTTSSTAVTTVKQEICNSSRDGDHRVLWGFPWQNGSNGVDGNSMNESWNGLGSSWHGLLNSPLM